MRHDVHGFDTDNYDLLLYWIFWSKLELLLVLKKVQLKLDKVMGTIYMYYH